ncbi:hypothetical protein DFQ26_007892, partial [Actinomortierella ambigua]
HFLKPPHNFLRTESLLRIKVKQAEQQEERIMFHAWLASEEVLWIAEEVLGCLPEHYAQGPDIRPAWVVGRRVGRPIDQLRRHGKRRTCDVMASSLARGQTKVGDLGRAAGVQENVLHLQVPVRNTDTVKMSQTSGNRQQ